MASAVAADWPFAIYSLFGGYNIYSPTVLYDQQEGQYKMWYGGWQTTGDYPNDRLYYRTSPNNESWSAPQQVLAPWDVHPTATHVNDPTITKHFNLINQMWQYTMFYTVCMNPCTFDPIESQVWSSVSADGIHWSYHQLLMLGATAPETPSAVVVDNPDGTFWQVYYVDRYEHTKIKMVRVNGNRGATSAQVVHEDATKHFANPEVRQFAGAWHLFYNVYGPNGLGAHADIYRASSSSSTQWPAGQVIVQNSDPFCGTLTPGVLPVGGTLYDLYLALWNKSGNPPTCTLPGGVETMQRWRMGF